MDPPLGRFSISRNVRQSGLCLCVPSQKTRFPLDWRLLVEERITFNGIPVDISGLLQFLCFFCVYNVFKVLESLQTSLLCIMGELAGEGSVAVAIGIGNIR